MKFSWNTAFKLTKANEKKLMPIPAAVRSTAWVYDRPLAGIAGSYPAECVEVSLMSVV
jgi:hypothetical protein